MRSLRGLREKLRTSLVRNAAYLIATEAVSAVLGLLFWAVAARWFADADVGVGAVLITSGTLLATLSTLGFNISLVRFLPERGTRVVRLINSSVTIGVAVAIVLTVVFGLLAGRALPALAFLSGDPLLIAVFAFFTAVWTASVLFDSAFVGLGEAKYVFVRAIVYNALKIPLPLALVALVMVPFALFSAWGVALLVSNALAALVLFARVVPAFRLRPDLDRQAVRSMLAYSALNHATNVLGAMPGLLFPLLVAAALPPENAAYFYIAWMIANLLFIVPSSIFTSVFAEGSRWLAGLRGHVRDGLYLALGLLIPGVAAVFLAGPTVLGVLRPSYRDAAVPLMDLLAASSFFLAINVLYVTVLRVNKRMRPVVGLYMITALGSLALGFPLMIGYGLIGAGAGFAVAQGAAAAYSLAKLVREGVLRRSA